ncbi:MAG: hypothetical protein HXY30_07020 [Pseudorhodoplanes sp.]|nr:hypothetical protein [Pseudorhodoplanes sp.]
MSSEGKPNEKASERPAEKPPADADQWQMALVHLKRAGEAGNWLRVLLFAASFGLIVFVLTEIRPGASRTVLLGHLAALALSGLSVFSVVRSWQVQREKSMERFRFLRTRDYASYLQYDLVVEAGPKNNERLDMRAFLLLIGALAIELAVRVLGVAHAVNV